MHCILQAFPETGKAKNALKDYGNLHVVSNILGFSEVFIILNFLSESQTITN